MNEEILNHLDKIKTLLDESDLMKDLLKTRQAVFENKILLSKIEQYKKDTSNMSLKKEIYEDENYYTYQKLENELYYLVLSINQRLNSLTEGKACQSESH